VESGSAPAGQNGRDWDSPLREALAGVAPGDREAISQLIALHREFPAWAVWLPRRGGPWVATRMASSRAPGPGLPMVWVEAMTATELARRMQAMDEQLAPR
jgi:hypothetical protein